MDGGIMEIENATEDTRFHDNPLVTGNPSIRFCAGQPLSVSGMPDAWLLNDAGEVSDSVKSSHVALGILPDEAFDATHVSIEKPGDLQLVMLSDGVLEAVNAGHEEYGQDRAKAVLQAVPRDARMEALLTSVFAHQGNAPQHDDMALAVLYLVAA